MATGELSTRKQVRNGNKLLLFLTVYQLGQNRLDVGACSHERMVELFGLNYMSRRLRVEPAVRINKL